MNPYVETQILRRLESHLSKLLMLTEPSFKRLRYLDSQSSIQKLTQMIPKASFFHKLKAETLQKAPDEYKTNNHARNHDNRPGGRDCFNLSAFSGSCTQSV